MRMDSFIQNNSIWLVPIVSIVLTVIIKVSSKDIYMQVKVADVFDFGFDLSTSSIIVLLVGVKESTGAWLLFGFFLITMVVTTIVNRSGWNTKIQCKNLLGIILPDIMGITFLILTILYIGGNLNA